MSPSEHDEFAHKQDLAIASWLGCRCSGRILEEIMGESFKNFNYITVATVLSLWLIIFLLVVLLSTSYISL